MEQSVPLYYNFPSSRQLQTRADFTTLIVNVTGSELVAIKPKAVAFTHCTFFYMIELIRRPVSSTTCPPEQK